MKFSGLLAAAILVSAVIFVSGCATSNVNPNETSGLFESISPKGVVLSNVRAYEDAGEYVIRGKVKRTFNNCCDATRGHIDIAVVAPDGGVMDVVSVPYTPRDIPRVRSRTSRFTARLPYTLAEDITLRIIYHGKVEVADSTTYVEEKFLCDKNIAVYKEEG
jgi:hypothetical protein